MSGFDNEVVYGEGIDLSGATVVANRLDTDGFLYIGNSSGFPQAALLTSSDSSVTWVAGSGTLDAIVDITNIPTVATSYTTDSGSAVPASNILTVSGGTGLSSSGSGSTLTVSLDTPVIVAHGGTNRTNFSTGSVIFADNTSLTQNNANFFWDNSNNRLGIGTTSPLDDLHVVGSVDVVHTSVEADDHGIEIDCDAAGFGDVKALDIDYITGAMTSVQDEECILVNIDETASTGGIVNGYEVLTTAEGSATINGYVTGINVNPIIHESGTFGNADDILNIAVDVTAALASGGAGGISIFVADDDTLTIGDAATWDEFEIILDTGASGGGVAPTFEFSTGGAGFDVFTPADGTNGFRNTGAILFDSASLVGWATAASGRFEIRITRTRNSLSTTPIIDELQISATTEFTWDSSGDVSINSLVLVTDLAVAHGGTGLSTITDGGIMLGSGTGAVTPLGQATDGQLPIGNTSSDPTLATLTAGTGVSITNGSGSITVNSTGGGFTWNEVTGTSDTIAANEGFIANNASLVTLTLPASCAVGDAHWIVGKGAGGWRVAQNAGDTIHFGNADTTTGATGRLDSTDPSDTVLLLCTTANTDWTVLSSVGSITVT